jgi:hypothetical protein
MRFVVVGGKGFRKADAEFEGVKGSWDSSGKDVSGREEAGVWKVIDLMNIT